MHALLHIKTNGAFVMDNVFIVCSVVVENICKILQ